MSDHSSSQAESDDEVKRKKTRLVKQRDLGGVGSRHIVAKSAELLEEQLFGSGETRDIAPIDRGEVTSPVSDAGKSLSLSCPLFRLSR